MRYGRLGLSSEACKLSKEKKLLTLLLTKKGSNDLAVNTQRTIHPWGMPQTQILLKIINKHFPLRAHRPRIESRLEKAPQESTSIDYLRTSTLNRVCQNSNSGLSNISKL
ncbi:hypothetical protein DPMN_019859 [Dreissena polymorpha]|uniref:Uncharacterized protein n=1 Tax=Dreissena polymorpha TaxID=45954 RepID=A0A9D4S7P7_DREPO|nr:hypothetical protein DPMN_019859 [Dreissena polymorpha]